MLLGEYNNDKFIYVGKVIMSKNKKLYDKLKNKRKSKNYFSDYNKNAIYIKPELTCFVEYQERTKSNHLRHSVFKDYE